MVEAGENEDGELGRDRKGKPSVWGAIGSHRRFHTGNDMVRSKITMAAGFVQGTLAQALPQWVEFTHQPVYQQIFNKRWLCQIQCRMLGIKQAQGNSLAVQWLGLLACTAESMGSVPGQGTKILHATAQPKTLFK